MLQFLLGQLAMHALEVSWGARVAGEAVRDSRLLIVSSGVGKTKRNCNNP